MNTMRKTHLLLIQLIILLLPTLNFGTNKIVYLISPPRSLSTAFLRMMEARGDFTVMNEPSLPPYQLLHSGRWNHQFANNENAHKTFEQVRQAVLKKSETSNIFVKEVSFSVEQFFLRNSDLLKRDNVYFIFLVRNPHHALVSFYNKCGGWLQRDSFTRETGYASTYTLFKHMQEHAVNKPALVLAEVLYTKPSVTIANICNFLAIPHLAAAQTWQSLDTTKTTPSWHNFTNNTQKLDKWHSDALQSTQFHAPTTYKTDATGTPSFEEITNTKHREICTQIYQENLHYYAMLLAERTL